MSFIEPSQETIDPASSVVAFSVNTRKARESELREYGRSFGAARLYLKRGGTIRFEEGETGLQRFLFEVSAQTIELGQFALTKGASDYSPFLYGTTVDGPQIQLTPGEITYLGRIEIEDIQFEDNPYSRPMAIKLIFSDAFEDDLLAWRQEYKIFQNRLPEKRIVASWGELEYVPVSVIQWSSAGFDISLPNVVLPPLSF